MKNEPTKKTNGKIIVAHPFLYDRLLNEIKKQYPNHRIVRGNEIGGRMFADVPKE